MTARISNAVSLVFMGSPAFSLPSLKIAGAFAQKHGGTISGIFTQPDRPSGRGNKTTAVAVASRARELGLPLFQPKSLRKGDEAKAALEFLQAQQPTFLVVVAYGLLLPKEILDIPRLGCINVHTSLLPEYRGAAPVQRALLDGRERTGVSTMLLDEGMDTGPILMQRETSVAIDENAEQLLGRLSIMGADLLMETLEGLLGGTLAPRPQPTQGASHAAIIEKKDGEMNWSKPALVLHNQVRALVPWPGAFTTFKGDLLKIHRAKRLSEQASGSAGTIAAIHPDSLDVVCGDGEVLRIFEVQRAGGNRQSAGAFANGARLSLGAQLGGK